MSNADLPLARNAAVNGGAALSRPRATILICAALEPARWSVWERVAVLLAHEYVAAVQKAGGLALMVPPDPRLEQNPRELLDLGDGLMLAGGRDIDPTAYGHEPHPETSDPIPERDRAEIALVRGAAARDMPVLGICRGMQLLNVAFGGTLCQHLPDELGHSEHRRRLGSFEDSDHDVRLQSGSLVARAAGDELHGIKSHHHQGVAEIGQGLEVTGRSTRDDLPEAIEARRKRFVLGVQWHPEADERSKLIGALVEAAEDFRRTRPGKTSRARAAQPPSLQ
ncbi:MAG: gamma-glutamyl-gamma-aminobutyrate hydrolase family protein [Solirubrobacterales bacterium]|nr:gamma-glutamyl-gamma-aminobutyrate hydrolase family protein [Solirubrobacterales bacterium]